MRTPTSARTRTGSRFRRPSCSRPSTRSGRARAPARFHCTTRAGAQLSGPQRPRLAVGAGIRRATVPVLPARPRRQPSRRGRALPRVGRARDQAPPPGPGLRVREPCGRVDLEGRRGSEGPDPRPRRPGDATHGPARRPRPPLPGRHARPRARGDRRSGDVRLEAGGSPERRLRHLHVLGVRSARAVRPRPRRADRLCLRRALRPAAGRTVRGTATRSLRRARRPGASTARRGDDGGHPGGPTAPRANAAAGA